MLFRKNIDPRCGYCEYARIVDAERMACVKRGIVPVGSRCAAFRYDPLKRVPPRPIKLAPSSLGGLFDDEEEKS